MAQVVTAEMTATKQIEVGDLHVSYGHHEVLHGVSFSARKGEFVAIVGQSGVGKSTLLYALAGFIEFEGDVHVPGRIGIVFQNYAVYPWLTVAGNVAFGLYGEDRRNRKDVVRKYLALVGLTDHAHKYPSQLSGGQSQRVALARALAANPEVIFFDEPFGALDIYTRDRMQTWLLEIWEKDHKTVLFVTHSIDEAVFLSDRVLVMGDGNIVGEFPVEFERPREDPLKFTDSFVDLKRRILETMQSS